MAFISSGALPRDSLGRESAVTEAIYLFCESADGICNEAISLTCLKSPRCPCTRMALVRLLGPFVGSEATGVAAIAHWKRI